MDSSGTVVGKSYPVSVVVSLQPNASDQGYIPYYTNPQKGCVLMITGGMELADSLSAQPEISLTPMNFSSPVYQFSYDNRRGSRDGRLPEALEGMAYPSPSWGDHGIILGGVRIL